jgi:hypothetical protein
MVQPFYLPSFHHGVTENTEKKFFTGQEIPPDENVPLLNS